VSAICIVDTSVFFSILNVPNKNQYHARAMAELMAHLGEDHTLLLPLAASSRPATTSRRTDPASNAGAWRRSLSSR
jgi:hypothetical protein